ncbi:MAG: DUF6263 family protein [Bacteroidales bacterium]
MKVGQEHSYILTNNTLQSFKHADQDSTYQLEILFGVLSKVNIKKTKVKQWSFSITLDSIYVEFRKEDSTFSWNSSMLSDSSNFLYHFYEPILDKTLQLSLTEEGHYLSISGIENYLKKRSKQISLLKASYALSKTEIADLMLSQRVFFTSLFQMAFFYPTKPIKVRDRWKTNLQIPDLSVSDLVSHWKYEENIGKKAYVHGKTDILINGSEKLYTQDIPFEYHLMGSEKTKIVVGRKNAIIRLGQGEFDLSGYLVFTEIFGRTETLYKIPVDYSGVTSIKTYFESDDHP